MTNKTKITLTTLITGLIILMFPAIAFAAPMNITQTAEQGETNPPSTITITDATGTTIKTIEYEGGNTTITPVEVTANQEYYVTAQATGYVFKKQGGIVTDAGANVKLIAVKASNLIITIKVDGITDYTGINVALYSGTDTTTEPKASAITNSTGIITFESVPHGDYTLILSLPNELQGTNIPTQQTITIPAGASTDVQISVPNNTTTTTEQGTITITATDTQGQPIKSAGFSIYKGNAATGTAIASGTTDNKGNTTITNIPNGTYTIRATTTPEGYTAPASQNTTINTTTPNTTLTFTFTGTTISTTQTTNEDLSQTSDPQTLALGLTIIAIGTIGITITQYNKTKRRK